MNKMEGRVNRLEGRLGAQNEPKRLEATDPDSIAILRKLAQRMPGPRAQSFLDQPLPCSEEEVRAAEERLAARDLAAAKQSPEQYLAELERTIADPDSPPGLVRMAERMIAMYEERSSARPDRAEEHVRPNLTLKGRYQHIPQCLIYRVVHHNIHLQL